MYVKTVSKKLKSGKVKQYYYFAEKIKGRENIIRSITEEEAKNFNNNKVSPIAETSRNSEQNIDSEEIEDLRAEFDKLKSMLLGNSANSINVKPKTKKRTISSPKISANYGGNHAELMNELRARLQTIKS
jgi:hypothetical protein